MEHELEEERQERVPLSVVASDLEVALPGNGNGAGGDFMASADIEEELLGDAPEGFSRGNRSFASLFTSDDEAEVADVDPSLMLKNCGLSEKTVRALEERGIFSLFPIQKTVFEPAMRGADIIARAKTGSGECCAAAHPMVCNLQTQGFACSVCLCLSQPSTQPCLPTASPWCMPRVGRICTPLYLASLPDTTTLSVRPSSSSSSPQARPWPLPSLSSRKSWPGPVASASRSAWCWPPPASWPSRWSARLPPPRPPSTWAATTAATPLAPS